jgi:hypothetical protein
MESYAQGRKGSTRGAGPNLRDSGLWRFGHPPLAFEVNPTVIGTLYATASRAPRIGREENEVETSKR